MDVADLVNLRRAAGEIFNSALSAVDPAETMRRAVQLDGTRLTIVDRCFDLTSDPSGVFSIAIGKAALPMAIALEDVLGRHLREGLIAGPIAGALGRRITMDVKRRISTAWRWCEGGHPLPNQTSLFVAKESFALLERANAVQAPIIFLISGGGSAMIEWPRTEQISLSNLRAANRLLISCGATIAEINSVRRAYSAIKGGRLAQRAPLCDQVTLIISDTNLGDEATVASGPTIDPPPDGPNASEVVARYPVLAELPAPILELIQATTTSPEVSQEQTSPPTRSREHYVLLSNSTALEAAAEAARSRGFHTEIAQDVIEQPIEEGCRLLLSRLEQLRQKASEHETVCLISGGEFRCPVQGDGIGGRNAESVLRCALEIGDERNEQDRNQHTVILSAGTDGIDGNSPAAGAFADETTVARARVLGLDVEALLHDSDAFALFDQLGDTLVTGNTGTNVRDVRVLLANGHGN